MINGMRAKMNNTHRQLLVTRVLAVFCAFPIAVLAQTATDQKGLPLSESRSMSVAIEFIG